LIFEERGVSKSSVVIAREVRPKQADEFETTSLNRLRIYRCSAV